MYDTRTESLAARVGILDRMAALEKDLLAISDIVNVEFDIRDWPDIPYVIIIPKYHFSVTRPDYFEARHAQCEAIRAVCRDHDLHPTGDSWEDMGEHWYIVRRAGDSWPKAVVENNY